MNPSVEVESVSKIYPQGETEVRALNSLSLAVQPGEFTAICGPSGSGTVTYTHLTLPTICSV